MIIQQGIREKIWSCLCLAYIFHDWRKFFIFHASKLWYFNERLLLSCLRVVTPAMLWPDIFWYYFCASGFACWALRTCASGWPLNTASQVQFDIFHLMPAELHMRLKSVKYHESPKFCLESSFSFLAVAEWRWEKSRTFSVFLVKVSLELRETKCYRKAVV